MKAYLWTQGETPISPAIFVLNGDMQVADGSRAQEDAFSHMLESTRRKQLSPSLLHVLKQYLPISSSQWKVTYRSGEGIGFQSVFRDTDEVGRALPFIFWCDTDDWDVAGDILQKYARLVNRSFAPEDLQMFRLLFKLHRLLPLIGWGSLMLILSLIIWKLVN